MSVEVGSDHHNYNSDMSLEPHGETTIMCSRDDCTEMSVVACDVGTKARRGGTAGTGELCVDWVGPSAVSVISLVYLDLALTNCSACAVGMLSVDVAESDFPEPACMTVAVCTSTLVLTAWSLVGCEVTSEES